MRLFKTAEIIVVCIGLTLSLATSGSSAESSRLSKVESQFIDALDNGNIDKANFYVEEGLVDPTSLSTGRSLESYLYGGWKCRGVKGNAYCRPAGGAIEFLVNHGVDYNKPIIAGRRPMTFICWGKAVGTDEAVEKFVSFGAEAEFLDNDGFTPLHYCASRRTQFDNVIKALGALFAAGADVNTRSTTLKTFVHLNFREKYGAGRSPLMIAVDNVKSVDNPNWSIIEYLIENGADAKAIDGNGFSVSNYVRYPDRKRRTKNTLYLLNVLHKAGADIMHKTPKGQNLFTLAVEKGEIEFAQEIRAISEVPR